MIFITHDLGIVAEFCNNVAVVYGGEVIERGSVDQVFTRIINHPYTHSLFECIPDLTSTAKRLPHFEGAMLDPTNLPKGCKYAQRCAACTELCTRQNPEMYTVEDGHTVKCYLFAEKK
jgi:peptide/nickel transport system ATP-binding protein